MLTKAKAAKAAKARFPLILAAGLWMAATQVQAGRPLTTEDADVLASGQCEAEGFVGRLTTTGEPATRGWTLQGSCGVGASTQVALAASRSRSEGVSSSGVLLGGKTGLIPREGAALGVTLAWGITGEKAAGDSLRHELSYLNLVATREFAPGWTGHGNLGWQRSQSSRSQSTTWNLAIERALGQGVDLGAEVYGDDHSDTWLGLGARWTVSESLSLNASWATLNATPRSRQWTIGFKYGF